MEKLRKQTGSGKVVDKIMVEETIRTIRETERQAQEIVGNAQRESERIRKEAEERSGQIREEIIRNAREEAAAVMEQAHVSGDESARGAEAVIRSDTDRLKTSAKEKEKEAVEMVISMLV